MLWYAEDKGVSWTTSNNTSITGTKKVQNGNKTFTSIPTMYHMLETNKIEFGPIVSIFEAKAGKYSDKYAKDLKSVGLDQGINKHRDAYNDVSSNAWQQKKNMKASLYALKMRPYGIMTFDNWEIFIVMNSSKI